MSFSVKLTDSQQCQVVVTGAVDKKGNPVPSSALVPVFASADTTICTFATDTTDPSGLTGLLVAVGPLASAAAISIVAAGITANGLCEIDAGTATSLSTTVGTPVEQP